jgi:NADH-quinone oxidoreductase subunit G
MDEVAEDPVLGFSQRGTHTSVTVHPGYRLDNNYSLNTADICPVGALTSNDFRFQMRVWFLKETKSIDLNCGTGANTTIWTRGNEIFRVTPRENSQVNSCWMPDSHRLAFKKIQEGTRLTSPLIKENGPHQECSWSEALSATSQGLTDRQPEEIAIIASARLSNEDLYLAKLIASALNTELLSIVPRIGESDGKLISADQNPNTTGAQLIWGQQNPAERFPEIIEGIRSGKVKAVLTLQEDLLEQSGLTEQDLQNLEFLVSSHILTNQTAALSHVVLPGSSFAEKRATYVNVTGRLQRANQAILPPGHARDDWETLAQLATQLNSSIPLYSSVDQVLDAISADIEEFAQQSFNTIGDLGTQITETGITIPLLEQEKSRKTAGIIVG